MFLFIISFGYNYIFIKNVYDILMILLLVNIVKWLGIYDGNLGNV